jgi:hypothetical protein
MREKIALGVGALLQFRELVCPIVCNTGRDDVTVFGGANGGLQQGIEPERAMIAQDRGPRVDAPGMLTACADVSGIALILRSRYHDASAAIGAGPNRYRR